MLLDQLERTIELLRQKLMAETDSYIALKHSHPDVNEMHPLYLKIKETSKQIQSLNNEYQRRLNKGIEHFDRFKKNKSANRHFEL